MGWVLYDDGGQEVADATTYWQAQDAAARDHASIFYVRWRWSDVEKQEGVYEWDNPDSNFSKLIQGARDRGLRLAFRFYVNPTDNLRQATPDWVRLACGEANGVRIQGKWSPYLDNPIFQQKFTTFITAFGARFDHPGDVDWIDVSAVGNWGEANNLVIQNQANKTAVYEWLLSTYDNAFHNVLLGMQYGTGFGLSNDIALAYDKYDCVLRRDGFGSQWVVNQIAGMQARFPKNPIFGEKAYWNNNEAWRNDAVFKTQMHSWEDVHRITLDQALACHANTMDLRTIWDTTEWLKTPDLVARFHRDGGYRLALDSVSFPTSIVRGNSWTVRHTWENHSVGVLPNHNKRWGNKYKVAFGLYDAVSGLSVASWIDETANPGDWVKGNAYPQVLTISGALTADLAAGTYQLTAAIVNTRADGAPDIQLSMPNPTTPQGASILGEVQVADTASADTMYWDGTANSALRQSDNSNTADQAWLDGGLWDNGIVSTPLATWTDGDSAIFGGSAASQTIIADVMSIGDMTFNPGTAYTIAGGAISLNTTTITTAAGAVISSNLGGDMLVKSGSARLTLAGNNSYGTGTSVTEGTLKISALSDSGLSNIGTSGFLSVEGGTLEYSGTVAATTSRALWINQSAGTFNVSDAAGSLAFTGNAGAIGNGVTKTGPGAMSLSHVLTGSATVTVNNGSLTLTGLNTFVGKTTVNGGLMVVQGMPSWNTGANGSRLGNEVEVNASGILRTGDHHQFGWTGTLANLTVNDGGTFNQNAKDQYIGNLTLRGNASLLNGSANYLGLSGGMLSYTGMGVSQQTVVPTKLRLRDVAGNGVTATVAVEGSNPEGDLVISGVIDSAGGLFKTGGGFLKLNGNNIYTGLTTVTSGVLGGTGSLAGPLTVGVAGTIAPGNSLGTFTVVGKTTLTGTYAAEINGATSDLLAVTGALDLTGATLTVSATSPTGSTWTIATYTGALTGTFSNVPSGYTINTGTAGEVKLVASDYTIWSATNAPGQTAGQDHDGDGVSNGVEYVLGGSATTQDSGNLPKVTVTGGNLVFTFKRIQSSKTLDTSMAIEVGTTLAAWPSSYTVGNDNSGSNAGSSAGVTVTDNLDGYDTVTLTIDQASDPKKFSRLNVTIN